MALEDSAEEGGIVGMDCAADTDRRLNPRSKFGQLLMCLSHLELLT